MTPRICYVPGCGQEVYDCGLCFGHMTIVEVTWPQDIEVTQEMVLALFAEPADGALEDDAQRLGGAKKGGIPSEYYD